MAAYVCIFCYYRADVKPRTCPRCGGHETCYTTRRVAFLRNVGGIPFLFAGGLFLYWGVSHTASLATQRGSVETGAVVALLITFGGAVLFLSAGALNYFGRRDWLMRWAYRKTVGEWNDKRKRGQA